MLALWSSEALHMQWQQLAITVECYKTSRMARVFTIPTACAQASSPWAEYDWRMAQDCVLAASGLHV
jgi:hypothetical protein